VLVGVETSIGSELTDGADMLLVVELVPASVELVEMEADGEMGAMRALMNMSEPSSFADDNAGWRCSVTAAICPINGV